MSADDQQHMKWQEIEEQEFEVALEDEAVVDVQADPGALVLTCENGEMLRVTIAPPSPVVLNPTPLTLRYERAVGA